MSKEVSVYKYQTSSGKNLWGYRFETASVNGLRKWKNKRGFQTKTEAAKAGRQALDLYENNGITIDRSKMSYADLLDLWLDSLRGVLDNTTVENYFKRATLYLKPRIGGKMLCSITKNDIKELLIELSESGRKNSDLGLSDNTLSVIRGIILQSFDYAVDEKILKTSPIYGRLPRLRTEKIIHGKEEKEDRHVFITNEWITKIFDRFPEGTPDHIPMMLGYKCGLRIAEAFALRWRDVDLTNKTITVNKQVKWSKDNGGYWFLTEPKYNSVRTISIDDDLAELLSRKKASISRDKEYYGKLYTNYCIDKYGHITVGEGDDIGDFVNVYQDGKYINLRTMQYVSEIVHHKMGFKEFDFHSFRGTHASILAENGALPMYVSNRLGHKNVETTLRYYYRYTNKMEEDGTKVLNKIFSTNR